MNHRVDRASDLNMAWAERFNARDLDGIVALFEPAAVFVPQPGTAVTGEGIRAAVQGFLDIGLPITMNVRNVFESGDVALIVADWSLSGRGADGSDVDLSGSTSDVARRGPDGWRFVIDNPFGTL